MTKIPVPHPIHLIPSEDEPEIILDKAKNILRFSGTSIPEDPEKLFRPVMNWVNQYVKSPNPETRIEFMMEYYNSSTARFFVEMLEKFEELHDRTGSVKIIWKCRKDDVVMVERGEDLKAIVDLPFEFIEYI
jgi:SiaC family regulatory phosphoprotein